MFNKAYFRQASILLSSLIIGLVLLDAGGCQAFAPAQTMQQKIAYAYGVHTAVLTATTQALNAKAIKSSDAQHVLDTAKDARTFLDAASTALSVGDTKTADGQLALATSILTQLQSYLGSLQ